MVDPSIPLNQQRAFPIQTLVAATAADQVTVLGGQVLRYWSAPSLGIAGIPATNDGNGHICCVGNFVNFSGCSVGIVLVTRFNGAAVGLGALPGMALIMQYRLTPTTVMPTSNPLGGGSINLDQSGMRLIQSTLTIFPAMNQNNTEFVALTFGPSADAGTGAVISPATIGSDIRFILSFSTNAVNANNVFTAALWGSS